MGEAIHRPAAVPGLTDSQGTTTGQRSGGTIAVHRQSEQRRGAKTELRWSFATALGPWVLSRAIVLAALLVANEVSASTHLSAAVARRIREGLLGWDAGWYEAIARHSYAGAGHESLRFFPLVPLLARGLTFLPGLGVGAALVIVSNISAFAATAWLAALAKRELGDESFGRRVAWLLSLAPPAFTMVMGYAEGTLLLLSVGTFWALRGRRWWWAAGLGFLAATCRPFGVLIAVPAAVEVLRARGGAPRRAWDVSGRAAAVVSPVLGMGAFLGWVAWRYGNGFAPLEIQEERGHRGAFTEPFRALLHDASFLVHGRHLGSALHLPWVVLVLALLAVAFLRLPSSYALFATAVVAASLMTANLDGFERYALSAFPLVLAACTLTRSARVERFVLVVAGAGMAGYALLAFMNVYVP